MDRLAERALIFVSYALQSIFEHRLAEIYQDAERELHEPQIGEHLSAVYRHQPLDGFQFHNEAALDKQIDLESVVYDNASKIHLNGDLSPNIISSLRQCGCQQTFVRVFEQARTQCLMDLKPKIDDVTGNRFQSIWLQHLRVLRIFV